MFHQTDVGNALFFSSLYKDKLRFDHLRGKWFIWRGDWWQPDEDGEIFRLAIEAIRQRRLQAQDLQPMEAKAKEISWTLKSESEAKLSAMIRLSGNFRPLAETGKIWDRQRRLLGVKNGVLDLQTGSLSRGQPEQRITRHTPIFYDPRATSKTWLETLATIFTSAELLDYFHKAIGYSITGEGREQCLFCLHGEGSNGKSTVLDALKGCLGDYAYTMPFSTVEHMSRSQISNDVAQLAGQRFVVASEIQENMRLNEGRVKSLTGDGEQTARFLYRENFTFPNTAKYWLAFNHKPRITDDSFGFWRRIHLIFLPRQFDGSKRDLRLMDKLQGEFQGILAWAVEGAVRWYREGLQVPKEVEEQVNRYRQEQDPLREYFEDRIEVVEGAQASNSELWADYLIWVRTVGEKFPLGRKGFSQRLQTKGFQQRRVGEANTRVWLGLQLLYKDSFPTSLSDSGKLLH